MLQVSRDGVTLYYDEDGGGGPPLLFVHGWCCDHSHFAPQFDRFRRERRCVAVDLRGHGGSDKPEQDYSMAGLADDLAWLCGQIGLQRPVVIGHSMGGVIGVELAARYPDLPAAVIAVDSPLLASDDLRHYLSGCLEQMRGPDYRVAAAGFVGNMFGPGDSPERRQRIVESMTTAPQHVMTGCMEGILAWDGASALKAVSVPLLSIVADMPAVDNAQVRALNPKALTGQTVGAGHFNQLEVPEQVNAMLTRFLQVSGV